MTESPKGTPHHERALDDSAATLSILGRVLVSLSDYSIRDTQRIGKYSPERTRPLLVTLLKARDVCCILQKVIDSPNVLPDGITIKRHMSPAEKHSESILLKQRWELSQKEEDKSHLKIKGNKLYRSSEVIGEVVDGEYRSYTN